MKCLHPIEVQTRFLPCGQCMNCRINKQRTWSSRIQLEAYFHLQSIFVTLTYDEKHVPMEQIDPLTVLPVLSKKDLQDFIKALRQKYSAQNRTFRMFTCGEYGNQTQRPHYHLILFGVGIDAEPVINKTWAKGFTQVSELTPERCSYIAQYTIKKMNQENARGLDGRPPEFASMSTRPGIGQPSIAWFYRTAIQKKSLESITENGDVWNSVRIGGKIWPIGNYLRRKLRERLGLSHNSEERAIQLDHFDPNTGEIFELPPLPEHYSPWQDINDYATPWRNANDKQETRAELPELAQKADHRERSRKRRQKTTAV